MSLPPTLRVLERGWLSANNIVFLDGDEATVVDTGYVTHAAQTVALVRHALDGRRLARVVNTHSHSDHIGGNAALQAAFGCRIVVPGGLAASVAEWDENALLLSPLGQQAARFSHDATLQAGDHLEMGGLEWEALAVPGHDMEALAYYNAEKRILISGDAFWQNGFGVAFPELLAQADGLAATRATLERLAALPLDWVIPGHGSPFCTVQEAFAKAFGKLAHFESNLDHLAWHGIKVIVSFAIMERRSLARDEVAPFLAGLTFAHAVNERYLRLTPDELAARVVRDLLAVGALRREAGGILVPA
ncbi:MAG: MBL fold metallo-hydrolase [Azonexus sp.]|nr:MBL fold metallo-hydrolase [Betaproteobacteria bacterium]MBK8919565.1 MBL fold metallo-hydrolase [Betaproteobacteria bacterium]MBP6036333.1 MBL fold metallo-hydrolase [Azonexus sp.]MBP6906803.1 MBL fold metallo-hydrolase [Azonexus sp.]